MSTDIKYYTPEGLQKMKDELNQLVMVERPSISRQIAEARDKGDLSENAEYAAAKEAQSMLELKISKLQDTLSNARLIDEKKLDNTKVLIFSTVKLGSKPASITCGFFLVPSLGPPSNWCLDTTPFLNTIIATTSVVRYTITDIVNST